MPATIIPAPPGYAVVYANPVAARFGPPATSNLFAIGVFDRGDVGQVTGVGGLRSVFGPRVNHSVAPDATATSLAEGARVLTVARIYGPGAAKASKTIASSLTIEAKSVGEYANGWTYDILDAGNGAVRVQVLDGDDVVTTSIAATTVADLAAWSLDDDEITITAVGATLPAVTADPVPLAGGTDDRANISTASIQAALDRLDPRYGPGTLIAPGITDAAAHEAILAHCDRANRVAMLDRPQATTKAQAITHRQTVLADVPALTGLGSLWAQWARATPIGGEPERLVPYSAIQAGITCRVDRKYGIGAAPFGGTNGAATTVNRLSPEWTDADRAELYAEGINVATDDGSTVATWGHRTMADLQLDQDLHVAHVRMALRWRAGQIAATYLGAYVDRDTLASYAGRLQALLDEFQAMKAVYGTAETPGYVIDVDSVNTEDTLARRELHAALLVKFTPTSDWVDLTVGAVLITDTL
jgi:hypothetical protein